MQNQLALTKEGLWLNWLLQHWSFYQQINISQWDLEDEEFTG